MSVLRPYYFVFLVFAVGDLAAAPSPHFCEEALAIENAFKSSSLLENPISDVTFHYLSAVKILISSSTQLDAKKIYKKLIQHPFTLLDAPELLTQLSAAELEFENSFLSKMRLFSQVHSLNSLEQILKGVLTSEFEKEKKAQGTVRASISKTQSHDPFLILPLKDTSGPLAHSDHWVLSTESDGDKSSKLVIYSIDQKKEMVPFTFSFKIGNLALDGDLVHILSESIGDMDEVLLYYVQFRLSSREVIRKDALLSMDGPVLSEGVEFLLLPEEKYPILVHLRNRHRDHIVFYQIIQETSKTRLDILRRVVTASCDLVACELTPFEIISPDKILRVRGQYFQLPLGSGDLKPMDLEDERLKILNKEGVGHLHISSDSERVGIQRLEGDFRPFEIWRDSYNGADRVKWYKLTEIDGAFLYRDFDKNLYLVATIFTTAEKGFLGYSFSVNQFGTMPLQIPGTSPQVARKFLIGPSTLSSFVVIADPKKLNLEIWDIREFWSRLQIQ